MSGKSSFFIQMSAMYFHRLDRGCRFSPVILFQPRLSSPGPIDSPIRQYPQIALLKDPIRFHPEQFPSPGPGRSLSECVHRD
jgi:hypothetical protein